MKTCRLRANPLALESGPQAVNETGMAHTCMGKIRVWFGTPTYREVICVWADHMRMEWFIHVWAKIYVYGMEQIYCNV